MKKLGIVILCAVLFLSGCANEQHSNNVTSPTSWQEKFSEINVSGEGQATAKPTVTRPILPEAGKMNQRYQPKEGQVELVLLYDANSTLIDETMLYELNTRIAEKGYGFYLSVIDEKRADYTDGWCMDYMNSGNQVDLVCTGGNSVSYGMKGTQTLEMIRKGLLLPFSDYPEIPEKQVLWKTYPEAVWEKWTVLGDVYGVKYSNVPFSPITLTINLELAENLKLEVPEKLAFDSMDEYLKIAAEAEYYPMVGGFFAPTYAGYTEILPGLYVKETANGVRAENFSEDEAMRQVLLAYSRYRKNGWVKNVTYQIDGTSDLGILHNKNTLIFLDLTLAGQLNAYLEGVYRPYSLKEEGDNHIEVKVKCYKQKNHIINENKAGFIMGISSGTKHPKEALQLLTLLQTDEQLVQLLRYGVENIHYVRTEDGYEKTSLSAGGIDPICNNFMYFEGFENMKNYSWPMVSQEKLGKLFSEDYTMILNLSLTEEQEKILEKASKIMESYNSLFLGKRDDVEQKLQEMAKRLEDIGYNRVIKEINEKYFEK